MEQPRRSVGADALALAQAAEDESRKLRFRLRRTLGLHRAYRKLLLDENGELRPEARTVLIDLAERSGLTHASPELDGQVLAMREGQRRVVLHMLGQLRLPEKKVQQIERDLDEVLENKET